MASFRESCEFLESQDSFDSLESRGSVGSPESLRGVEDAEAIWDTIAKRFPNSAPLLCELETVIDRAECLLRQLGNHSSPKLEKLGRCRAQGSDLSNDVVQESFTEVNDELKNDVTTSIAETQISDTETDLESSSRHSLSHDTNVEKILPVKSSFEPSYPSVEVSVESSANTVENATDSRTINEIKSLEGWEKLVNEITNEPLVKETQDNTSKAIDEEISMSAKTEESSIEKLQNLLEKVNAKHAANKEIDSNNAVQAKEADKKSPRKQENEESLSILEEYARRCKMEIECQYETLKTNRLTATIRLAAFKEMGLGETQRSAKNNSAKKMLRSIAEYQMDDKNPAPLLPFATEEMKRIVQIAENLIDWTTQRKLCKLCLENDVPLPKYEVQKKTASCIVQCVALGFTGTGKAVRESKAKQEAAEDLYRQYQEAEKTREKART